MNDIAVQLAVSRAASQYQNTTASGVPGATGSALFSDALAAAQTATEADAPPTGDTAAVTARTAGTSTGAGSILSSLAPLFLSGFSSGSGGTEMMLMLMVAAILEQNGGSGLLGDSSNGLLGSFGALGSDSMLSLFGGSLFGGDMFGGSTSDGIWGSGSAATQATMMAAQSLFKAYSNVAADKGSTSATGSTAMRNALIQSAVSGSVSGGVAAQNLSSKAVGSKTGPGARVTPEVVSTAGNRSAALYRAVIDQFDVEDNPRYAINQKGQGDTYCNIFMWDVTSAMGAEIPYHTDKATGAPLSSGQAANAVSMSANRMSDWLNTYGAQYGWYEVTAEQAQALANRGCPAVTIWKNPTGGHGHAQVVSPSEDGLYDPSRGVAIAQAGKSLHNYTYIRNLYTTRMAEVQYFAHL